MLSFDFRFTVEVLQLQIFQQWTVVIDEEDSSLYFVSALERATRRDEVGSEIQI